jgi:hypothetical protein
MRQKAIFLHGPGSTINFSNCEALTIQRQVSSHGAEGWAIVAISGDNTFELTVCATLNDAQLTLLDIWETKEEI